MANRFTDPFNNLADRHAALRRRTVSSVTGRLAPAPSPSLTPHSSKKRTYTFQQPKRNTLKELRAKVLKRKALIKSRAMAAAAFRVDSEVETAPSYLRFASTAGVLFLHDLWRAILEEKTLKTKSTTYDPAFRCVTVRGYPCLWVGYDHRVESIKLPIGATAKDLSLIRLRARQLGVECYARNKKTEIRLRFSIHSPYRSRSPQYVPLTPGATFDIPEDNRFPIAPKSFISRAEIKVENITPQKELLFDAPFEPVEIPTIGKFPLTEAGYVWASLTSRAYFDAGVGKYRAWDQIKLEWDIPPEDQGGEAIKGVHYFNNTRVFSKESNQLNDWITARIAQQRRPRYEGVHTAVAKDLEWVPKAICRFLDLQKLGYDTGGPFAPRRRHKVFGFYDMPRRRKPVLAPSPSPARDSLYTTSHDLSNSSTNDTTSTANTVNYHLYTTTTLGVTTLPYTINITSTA